MRDLTGKRFLITGASSGIGAAVARGLALRNASVVLMARDRERLEMKRQSLHNPEQHQCVCCDLKDAHALQPVIEELSKDGLFHGLVHAAGIRLLEPLRASQEKTWLGTMQINLLAAMQLIKAFRKPGVRSPEMVSAVFISSVAGQFGAPALSAYSASKGALDAAARAWAIELAPEKIRVNTVSPGYVCGNMLSQHMKLLTSDSAQRLEAAHPLGFGTPEDVADAVLFLLSDAARWITGTTLRVDGGYSAL